MLQTILTEMVEHGCRHWKKVLGPVHFYPLSTHPYCNGEFRPSGPVDDVVAVLNAIDVVWGAHPYVS